MKTELTKCLTVTGLTAALNTRLGFILAVTITSAASFTLGSYIIENQIDKDIFASKVSTLNIVYNQYEASNVTGYSNCIKSHSKDLCLTRMESISIHFANEYNKKLLKLITDEYGIDTLENKASGRLTAIGVKKTNLEYIVNTLNPFTFDKLGLNDGKYSISFKQSHSRMPTIQEAYGMNEMRKGENMLLSASLNKGVNKDIKDIAEHKGEVVSIGAKFAELGLKTQEQEGNKVAYDMGRLLDLVANEEKTSGLGKSPAVMDTVTYTGTKLFNSYSKAAKDSLAKPIEENK